MSIQNQPTAEQFAVIQAVANFSAKPMRTPILKNPADHGMAYEDVFFPSLDGVPLEAWYIPAVQPSDLLIIANHPLPMNRYGLAGHLSPWDVLDPTEINFLFELKHLHDAGYNILTYDLRNLGRSGTGGNGACGVGRYEWRDCVGAQNYVNAHPELSKMKVGLLSRCTGGNAQYEAISRHPELFKDVACMVSPLVVSMEAFTKHYANSVVAGAGDFPEILDFEQVKAGGLKNSEMTPHLFAPDVTMPTLVVQVREDRWTSVEDGEKTFELLGAKEKELFWIEGTPRRWVGYNYFGSHPEKLIGWFDKYMKV
ncbi:alpha/beta hydrolase [Salmonella enterica subsp. enterica serovar Mbandaka]|uniref:alpha/beta hydrolase family protein n=1 Tax=Salmonella enterica TaxID=28901 RepID=UPI001406D46F|nr:alpha/beta hydrolase [Salmonella enterica subsp. enterica serovar Mbandaka]